MTKTTGAVEDAVAIIRRSVPATPLVEFAGRILQAERSTNGHAHRLREEHVVLDVRVRSGRAQDAEVAVSTKSRRSRR